MIVRLLIIAGPTAVGKTRLGVDVAHTLGSEILSADSRQVYRGLDLGTGKDLDEYFAVDPPIRHHLIDIADPDEIYTLFRYQQDCYEALRRLARKEAFGSGRVPLIMVGGSGLYIEAVLRDYHIADVPQNLDLRQRLGHRSHDDLVDELRLSDSEFAHRADLSSRERVIRALEIVEAEKRGPVQTSEPLGLDLHSRAFVIRIDRRVLRRRIRSRLEGRLADGMIDEVRGLLAGGLPPQRLERLGLEYREVGAYLAGDKTRHQMVDDLATGIGRFAKRQETWFKGMERRGTPITWIAPSDRTAVLAAIEEWTVGA